MPPDAPGRFDPLGLLAAIQKRHASFILIGALARITQGTDELTHGVDITPWMRPTTLDNLSLALTEINARRPDGQPLTFDTDEPVIELETDFGQLKIVPQPAGTRGYEDLRRAATHEYLGKGVRPHIASVGDLVRMAGALYRDYDRDLVIVNQLRRIAELERDLGISREL
ncbi:MAG: hypothetical protein M3546_06470 [Actinomycetota bacterium]|nr:hypothetical protein [Actinomycetota bacterium]